MNNPKIIVMDLGGTIIDNYSIDFTEGFKYLYDNYFNHDVPFESLKEDIDDIYNRCYQKRNNDDFEINFHNYLRYVERTIGFNSNISLDKLEREFIDHAFKSTIVEGVDKFLKYIKSLGIDIYILSNSCFTKQALIYELSNVGLLDYFKDVFSSADYLMRKPNNLFFNIITKYFKRINRDINLNDIWYIGNEYKFDVFGSINAGLSSVWLNRLDEENTNNYDCLVVHSYAELVDYLRRNNHD